MSSRGFSVYSDHALYYDSPAPSQYLTAIQPTTLNKMLTQNRSLWIITTLLVAGSVFLLKGGPDYYAPRSIKCFWDLGHILYFALMAMLLSRARIGRRMPLMWQWISILGITLVIGIAIELLQYGTARTPDSGDILRDLTGSLLILVFGPLGSRLQPAVRRHSLQFSVIALILLQVWPLVRSLVDEAIAWYQFPLLSGFETPFEIDRWAGGDRLSVETATPISKGNLLMLSLTTDKYSGATLKYFNGNWTSARTLVIRFYNPDASPLQITCRIHDQQHSDSNEEYEDRYNQSFLLAPAWNRITIDLEEVRQRPSGREMDMSRIRGLTCFAISLPSPRVIYLDEVRLAY